MSGSPERLYLKVPIERDLSENEIKHFNRYRLASLFARGDILDIACGSGYGSKILSTCGNVLGVDRDSSAIEFANLHNKNEDRVEFLCSDVDGFEPNKTFDTIVCVETFEHLEANVGFDILLNFKQWLNKNGHLIITTPMLRFKDGKPYVTNPFHINELARDSIETLFNYAFPSIEYKKVFLHQCDEEFQVLGKENTGFMVMIARKL